MSRQVNYKIIIKKLLGSKTFLFFIVLILIVLSVNLGRESYRKYQLTKEIDNFRTEIERLEGRKQQLASLMEYFKDDSYLEREARLKFNLKKPGEKVVVLSEKLDSNIQENTEVVIPPTDRFVSNDAETTNYWEWWKYFFGK
ncbi:MAG: septum formation initiator family protein [bacterium]